MQTEDKTQDLINAIGIDDNNHLETTIIITAISDWREKNKDKKLSIGNFADIIKTNTIKPNKNLQDCFNHVKDALNGFEPFITEAKECQSNISSKNNLKSSKTV